MVSQWNQLELANQAAERGMTVTTCMKHMPLGALPFSDSFESRIPGRSIGELAAY
jgi:hypothetical protein